MRSLMKGRFIQDLEKIFGSNHPELVNIYSHLFKIKDDAEFEEDLIHLYGVWNGSDSYFGKEGEDIWFTIWHKKLRQNDYFNSTFKVNKLPLLSKEELSELRGLRYNLSIGTFKKSLGEDNMPFTPEYKRILELGDKQRREKENENISGHLDMILWNTIHLDNKNILSRHMEMFFSEDMKEFIK